MNALKQKIKNNFYSIIIAQTLRAIISIAPNKGQYEILSKKI
jgi:hypothetical protein